MSRVADPEGRTGQSTPRATHLIKRACQVATDRYRTSPSSAPITTHKNGTGVRDYIHVSDLVDIHQRVLRLFAQGRRLSSDQLRLWPRFSVRQVAATVERVSGQKLVSNWRPAAPATWQAWWQIPPSYRKVLGWKPKYGDLDTIVTTALNWERRLKDELGTPKA